MTASNSCYDLGVLSMSLCCWYMRRTETETETEKETQGKKKNSWTCATADKHDKSAAVQCLAETWLPPGLLRRRHFRICPQVDAEPARRADFFEWESDNKKKRKEKKKGSANTEASCRWFPRCSGARHGCPSRWALCPTLTRPLPRPATMGFQQRQIYDHDRAHLHHPIIIRASSWK